MRCQRCDQRDRRPVRRAELAERDAKVALVLDVPMQGCPACGERWQDWDIARRLEELLTAMLAATSRSPPGTSMQPTFPSLTPLTRHRRGAPDSFDRSRRGRWLDLRSLDRRHVTARLRTLPLHESCRLRP
jgi:hypothetical protein